MLSFSWLESRSQELGELLGRAENHPRKGFLRAFLRAPHLPHALPDPSAWLQCPGTSGKCCWPRPTALLAPRARANPSLRAWRLQPAADTSHPALEELCGEHGARSSGVLSVTLWLEFAWFALAGGCGGSAPQCVVCAVAHQACFWGDTRRGDTRAR